MIDRSTILSMWSSKKRMTSSTMFSRICFNQFIKSFISVDESSKRKCKLITTSKDIIWSDFVSSIVLRLKLLNETGSGPKSGMSSGAISEGGRTDSSGCTELPSDLELPFPLLETLAPLKVENKLILSLTRFSDGSANKWIKIRLIRKSIWLKFSIQAYLCTGLRGNGQGRDRSSLEDV